MSDEAVVVFTFKSVQSILRDGGTSWWRLDRSRARSCKYAVCTRNAKHELVEGDEPHHAAFLVGKIKDVVLESSEDERFIILFSEFARVNVPDAWTGRNPVQYRTLEDLGIDAASLKWETMPRAEARASETAAAKSNAPAGLTIAEAKRGLALTYGLSPDNIEITIRG